MTGRRASFPPVETTTPRPLGTVRFEIPVEDGKHVVVTLNDASRCRLVRALGSALRDSLTAPGVVCTPTKVRTHVDQLRRFLYFLDDAGEAVDRVEAIEPALLDRYEVWLKRHTYAGAIYRRHLLARPIALLRRIEELKPGTLLPALLTRLTYLSLDPYKNSRPRDAYSGAMATRIQLETFAQGHSVEVAAEHYADIPALRPIHEATIAAAIEDAMVPARREPCVLNPKQEAAIRRNPRSCKLPPTLAADAVVPLLDGAQDLWLAGCAGFYDSPFGTKGEACPSPFWSCLDCGNAVITARKLPALIAFLGFTTAQRESLTEADWEAKFGQAHRRIRDQIIPAFPKPVVAAARDAAEATPGLIYLPPEASAI